MLKDRYFYPLAIAFITAIIWYALSKADHDALTTADIWEYGFIVQGEDLVTLTASPGTSYKYKNSGEMASKASYVTIFANIARKDAPASAGVFASLGPKYEAAFANQRLMITIRARQGRTKPLTQFDMGYFTADVGDSGWIRKSLTPDWKNYSFEFSPKTPVNNLDVDYLGIWPGEKGDQETMDIEFMKIDVLPQDVSKP